MGTAAIDFEGFARDGYIVLRDPIEPPLLQAAVAEIDGVLREDPDRSRPGMHSRDRGREDAPASFLALTASALWSGLSALISPGELELVSPQLQLVFNNPPGMHNPDVPHIDYHVAWSVRIPH